MIILKPHGQRALLLSFGPHVVYLPLRVLARYCHVFGQHRSARADCGHRYPCRRRRLCDFLQNPRDPFGRSNLGKYTFDCHSRSRARAQQLVFIACRLQADVINSTLLAQLEADQKYDRCKEALWWCQYYLEYLSLLGWETDPLA